MPDWNITLIDTLTNLFSTERFMPHGYCFLWQQELLWMHVIGDIAIAIAYFSIPITILYLLRKNRQTMPYRWVFNMFAIFIFLCGATHLIELVTLWYPIYYLEGLMKVLTAAVSVATAIMIFPLIPALMKKFSQLSSLTQTAEHVD
ncbi:hypothetical protein FKG94_02255 [Exilibacterium tricleocarpae]|uniref:Ethylene receptor 1-like N-terminal domain-containing protein n=1 Tax=Exilibacterium tricleocarpae TaxID=2591008 RepID=A0A545U886_9GAMM|nr:hypothetical protein [Exilibacterium tricleocarpae]TQV85687.1 hypothetical protein FKG94_02255 [Exilibacterium tricleocarpae]